MESRVISSLSAFISSSLYWKSLTMNLETQSSGQKSVHTFSLHYLYVSISLTLGMLTCSLWLCVWSHRRLSWTEWRWTVHCHCLHTADCKNRALSLLCSNILTIPEWPEENIYSVYKNAFHPALWYYSLWWSRHHHLSQCFICFLPVSVCRSEGKEKEKGKKR